MKKTVRLYNVIFPIWLLLLFPQVWLIALPGNLAVDCLVLLAALTVMRQRQKGAIVKKLWWRFWLLGFGADAAGVVWMGLGLLPAWVMPGWSAWEDSVGHITHNAFAHPAAFAWTLAGVALSGTCIYFFDKRAMAACPQLSDSQRHKIALAMAAVTAPWLFFIPVY